MTSAWNEQKLARLGAKILIILKVRKATFDIVLLPDGEMKRLKALFLRKKTEPNVLAFPEPEQFPHPETKKKYLGEIYLNKTILSRSPERGAPLLLHGILHILGYDHKKKADIAKMEGLEKKILEQLRFYP